MATILQNMSKGFSSRYYTIFYASIFYGGGNISALNKKNISILF